mmetsp:Transcript_53058/g.125311  ORF Transcript_53058/g.125311 Transcript_53058/m.125311 type:complete len:208 (+) Transcript_53058:60-683(+)
MAMLKIVRTLAQFGFAAVTWHGIALDAVLPGSCASVVGKFIYLTVQSLYIVFAYYVLSFMASFLDLIGYPIRSLDRFAHWASAASGGFALFYSIMFYLVVYSDPKFHDIIREQEAQGIPFEYSQHWVHAPPIFMVPLDALLKEPEKVTQTVLKSSGLSYLPYFIAVGIEYIIVLHYNFNVNKVWPYPFMDDFTSPWQPWSPPLSHSQ